MRLRSHSLATPVLVYNINRLVIVFLRYHDHYTFIFGPFQYKPILFSASSFCTILQDNLYDFIGYDEYNEEDLVHDSADDDDDDRHYQYGEDEDSNDEDFFRMFCFLY